MIGSVARLDRVLRELGRRNLVLSPDYGGGTLGLFLFDASVLGPVPDGGHARGELVFWQEGPTIADPPEAPIDYVYAVDRYGRYAFCASLDEALARLLGDPPGPDGEEEGPFAMTPDDA
jgi:hypothetical protein